MNNPTIKQAEFQFPDDGPNPSGLCMCGCGQRTPIARWSDRRTGIVKGKPVRFVTGHGGAAGIARPVRPTPDRLFWEKVDKSGGKNSCWLWTASKTVGGYGQLRILGEKFLAHRYSWELHNGKIPDGMHVLHSCDVNYPPGDITNRSCVNPSHLWLGTPQDNLNDMTYKGRRAEMPSTIGVNHPNAKLTEEDVREIRKLSSQGVSYSSIANIFRVTKTHVGYIVHKKSWSHVT